MKNKPQINSALTVENFTCITQFNKSKFWTYLRELGLLLRSISNQNNSQKVTLTASPTRNFTFLIQAQRTLRCKLGCLSIKKYAK